MNFTSQQREAISHLSEWRVGALFMEAGTGKTRVACNIINAIDELDLVVWCGPLQTIRPSSSVPSVIDEINKWGGLKCKNILYCGVESLSSSERKFLQVLDSIQSHKNVFMVVDESLKIKNAHSIRTRRILELSKNTKYRLILNGTPLSRNLMDMWSQMEFLSPRILNMDLSRFKRTFCRITKITEHTSNGSYSREYISGMENVDYLYSLIRQYIYQCDLNLNITQNYHNIGYHVEHELRSKYIEIKDKYLKDDTLEWLNNNIFMQMTQEMQHSYCLSADKFKRLDDLFSMIDEEKTIIFCKYVDSRKECERRYKKALVLSYQTSSFGLNLQDFRYTVYFDKIWDLALRVQSERRTFRTGQEYNCQYYDMTGDVKLDGLIDKNIEKKVSMTEYFKSKTKEQINEALS